MEQGLRDVLEQYIEGAITAKEYINYTLKLIGKNDPIGFDEFWKDIEKRALAME